MDDTQKELNRWYSTYGMITADRILSTFQISISRSDFLTAMKSPFSFYHQIVQVPLKNVLNGIVLQQANDYHVYAQKLFVDYLLSTENLKEEEEQGGSTREDMENERKKLVVLGEKFYQIQLQQDTLISSSQASLIKMAREWKTAVDVSIRRIHNTLKSHQLSLCKKTQIRKGLEHALIHCNLSQVQSDSPKEKYVFIEKINDIMQISIKDEIKEELLTNLEELLGLTRGFHGKISTFLDQVVEMGGQAQTYRTQFYETIINVMQIIKLLPDYRIDPVQDAMNREALYFDKTIGQT